MKIHPMRIRRMTMRPLLVKIRREDKEEIGFVGEGTCKCGSCVTVIVGACLEPAIESHHSAHVSVRVSRILQI